MASCNLSRLGHSCMVNDSKMKEQWCADVFCGGYGTAAVDDTKL